MGGSSTQIYYSCKSPLLSYTNMADNFIFCDTFNSGRTRGSCFVRLIVITHTVFRCHLNLIKLRRCFSSELKSSHHHFNPFIIILNFLYDLSYEFLGRRKLILQYTLIYNKKDRCFKDKVEFALLSLFLSSLLFSLNI